MRKIDPQDPPVEQDSTAHIEWYSDSGRVVLVHDPSQIEIVRADVPPNEKTPAELLEDKNKRDEAFGPFLTDSQYIVAATEAEGERDRS
jgi:hypothetical protein